MRYVRLFEPDGGGSARPQTVADLAARYLDSLRARVLRDEYGEETCELAALTLANFVKRYGEHVIADCQQSDLTAWLEGNPNWKSSHTRKRCVGTILACFRWAEYEGLIDRCPYKRPKELNTPDRPRRPATAGEYILMMRHGSRAIRRVLYFLRRTGARTCEVREILWGECHLDGPSPHIRHAKHKNRRKTKLPRKIGLDTNTARFLKNLKRQAPQGQQYVFLNCDGMPWQRQTLCRHFRRLAEALGLDEGATERVTGYCLRHSYTVDAITGGMGERQIADQLGHARTDMIGKVYGAHTRQMEDHLANVAREVISLRRRKKPGGPAA